MTLELLGRAGLRDDVRGDLPTNGMRGLMAQLEVEAHTATVPDLAGPVEGVACRARHSSPHRLSKMGETIARRRRSV